MAGSHSEMKVRDNAYFSDQMFNSQQQGVLMCECFGLLRAFKMLTNLFAFGRGGIPQVILGLRNRVFLHLRHQNYWPLAERAMRQSYLNPA